MKYNYEYEIKYQEVDGRKRLRLFNLENYLLEVAGTVADELGFGIRALHPMGLTWILTRLSVEMYELPTHCERVRFETWIESNAHMLSTRNFRIYTKESKVESRKSKVERGRVDTHRAMQDRLGDIGYPKTRDCQYLRRPDV